MTATCPDCNGLGYTIGERTRRRRNWKKGYVISTQMETITCHRCGATGQLPAPKGVSA